MKPEKPSSSPVRSLVIYSDGAARGNPGPAGAGAVLLDAEAREVAALGRYLGETTNNVAEYQGLLLGLKKAAELGAVEVSLRLDSELVVKQLNGAYRVKSPHLKPLYEQARRLLKSFERVEVAHVPREQNRRADELANQAID